MNDSWRGALSKGLIWFVAFVVPFTIGWAVSDRVSIGRVLDNHTERLVHVEATYVTQQQLTRSQAEMDRQIDESLREIIQCLNRIQRNDTCDF
jgi:hypothetical protein